MRTAPPVMTPLFRSDGQARLLAELFLEPDREFSISELATDNNLAYATTHREVSRLVEAGLLEGRRVGQTRVVHANTDAATFRSLHELLLATFGPVPLLRAALADVEGLEAVVLFGSFAARTLGEPGPAPADVDVLVVGSPVLERIYEVCVDVGRQVRRPVNPTVMTAQEWQEAAGFASEVAAGPVVPVLGELPARVEGESQ